MKRNIKSAFFLSSLFLSFHETAVAQAPGLQWAKALDGTLDDNSYSLATDAGGNVYTTGRFAGTVDFDPGPGTFYLTSSGNDDVFISKLDGAGNFIWAKRIGGAQTDDGLAITLDDSANVYTAGLFIDSVDFDPGAGTFILTAPPVSGGFISKLDSAGNFIWAKAITGPSTGTSMIAIHADASHNLFLTGYFTGTTDFDPGAGNYFLTSNGSYGIFILKLDSLGNFSWARSIDGNADRGGYSIKTDLSGNVYVTGLFQGTADFDPGPAIYTLISVGYVDIFVLKLDGQGNFDWAKSMGGSGYDAGYSLGVDQPGNNDIYITGLFEETVDFDPGNGTYYLSSPGNQDAFVCKLVSSGNLIWVKAMGGPIGSTGGLALSLDVAGNVYTSGFFSDLADFDPNAGVNNLTSVGLNDIFVSKLNSAGNFQWVKNMGASNDEYTQSMAIDMNYSIYLTGGFKSDTLIVASDTLFNADASGNTNDIFIIKISCSSFSSINPIACLSYTSPSGNYTWSLPGTYMDTIPNVLGCDSIMTINLTVNTVDTSLLQNGTTLTSNAAGAAWQWLDCNNGFAAITGATNQAYSPSTNGNYAVAITQNGCTDTSSCHTVTGVGIKEIYSQSNFVIYPNPSHQHFTITLKSNPNPVELTIRDMAGKIIYAVSSLSQKNEIDTREFADGLYFVQIQTPEFTETKKLIIVR